MLGLKPFYLVVSNSTDHPKYTFPLWCLLLCHLLLRMSQCHYASHLRITVMDLFQLRVWLHTMISLIKLAFERSNFMRNRILVDTSSCVCIQMRSFLACPLHISFFLSLNKHLLSISFELEGISMAIKVSLLHQPCLILKHIISKTMNKI